MLVVFSLTLFLSAVLLFLVEPMFAKMVLPLLGGSPSVWNTCMVFYQAALLAGYAYAHAAPRWLGVRRQAAVHLFLLFLVFLTLPIGLSQGWAPSPTGSPLLWLLQVLLVVVGLPFFVISATAPLLQKWFAHSGHPTAGDPYFLYGASNLGSLAALVGYPLVVEPKLRLADQAWVWAGGYLVLTGLIAVCAVMLWRSRITDPEDAASLEAAWLSPNPTPLTWSQRLWWVLLAFAPSSLMLGVTTYLSTDIAAMPLLWVIPLAIYLLTFVLVFARRPILPHRLMVMLEPFSVIPLAIIMLFNLPGSWLLFPVHLVTFFLLAMVCHGELMKARPAAAHLTEFYLWLSVGGVLGGLFNAIIAPVTFKSVIEYPLIIVVACLLRPYLEVARQRPYRRALDFLLPLSLLVLLGGFFRLVPEGFVLGWALIYGFTGLFCFSFRHRPVRFGLGLGALLLAGAWFMPVPGQALYTERNFFGRLQVKQDEAGTIRILTHGTTLHGAQNLAPAQRREPLTYYYRQGPLGQVFAGLPEKNPLEQVAIIGLGTGTIACYAKAGQHLTFYEIDPAVERIARDPRYFTYLSDCPARVEVVLGDARLSLQQAPDSCYDLIILDAFSSDAVPVHLLTREALGLYLSKLKEGGLLAFNITNRYLDLRPVLGNLARHAALSCLVQADRRLTKEEEEDERKCSSTWVIMAREVKDLGRLVPPRWQPLPGWPGEAVWTDDFSNVMAVCKWSSVDVQAPLALILNEISGGWRSLRENLVSFIKREKP